MRAALLLVILTIAGCDSPKEAKKGSEPERGKSEREPKPVAETPESPKTKPAKSVTCFPVDENGWTLECEVTGKGASKGEAANRYNTTLPTAVRLLAKDGKDPTRSLKTMRWVLAVKVEASTDPAVVVGKVYELSGALVSASERTIKLTDCVFTPRK